ncbi:hypothetical protein DTO006G1_9818 [Penicillium roqueforti]|nr:hypothetical protein CBS147337_9963 [Penicillium roqueforti]KAI2700826.1 hypothetical protein CBS147354_9784 [Penicillium roqueforti]KAI2750844.1 hypothetical protein DTO006G1_9818 [Penicillium roqueforti]KAI3095791.1 hypothetical protein CBS147333_9724 [Penicillium roqueforti]KAI3248561.1 hypothetical protein DTO006G7_9874 [Penicillium roqueforti]
MSLSGKVVVITGAGSGIGRATAARAAGAGAILTLGDINADGLDDVLHECRAVSTSEITHMALVVDVTSASQCTTFIDRVVATHRQIDHLFNCAGINPTPMLIEQTADEYWDRLLNTNLRSVFYITRLCLSHMPAGSSIVNVSSVCGNYPVAQMAVYCAAKHGVIGFSKSLALEVGCRGIRVNVVAPGAIETPTNSAVVAGPEALDRAAEGSSLKRLGRVDEVASVVLFLFSGESSYINGAVVNVDGGIGLSS